MHLSLFLFALVPKCVLAKPTRPTPAVARRSTFDSPHKAGLAWSDTSVDVSQFLSKVGWCYNWSPTPPYPQSAMKGLEYVPMFWGNKSISQIGDVHQLVSGGGIAAVLGMNEPTTPGQSELSPGQAAELWIRYMEPLKQASSSLRLGSPALANGEAGIPWLQQFFGNCSGCSVDFVALHYYYIDVTDFINYVVSSLVKASLNVCSADNLPPPKNGYHDTFQKPIWITEWACVNFANSHDPCPDSYIPEFMNKTQSYMDHTDWIERYAWFGAFRTMPGGLSSGLRLYDEGGHITKLGRQYIGNTSNIGGPVANGGKSLLLLSPWDISLASAFLSSLIASLMTL